MNEDGSEADRKIGVAEPRAKIVSHNAGPLRQQLMQCQVLAAAVHEVEPSTLNTAHIHLSE